MHWQEKLRHSGALYTMVERLERKSSRAIYQEGGPLVRPENPQPWMSLPMFVCHCYLVAIPNIVLRALQSSVWPTESK
jgi:hypothetical protein